MFSFILTMLICIFLFISAYQILVKDNFKFAEIPEVCLQKISQKERSYLRKSIGISYILIGLLIWLLIIIESVLLTKLILISVGIISINLVRVTIKFVYSK